MRNVKRWYNGQNYGGCPELKCREREDTKSYYGKVRTLEAIADISMIIGIVLAIITFATMGMIDDEANAIGIIYSLVLLFATVVNWAVLRVICVIANNIIVLRENSDNEDKKQIK